MGKIDVFDFIYYITNKKYGSACYRDGQNTVYLFEFDGTYVKQIEPDFPNMVCYQTLYSYDTLKPKVRGQYLKYGSVSIGVWEYFDENGKLNYTVDMDKDFPIKWSQLEKILKDKDISLLTVDSIFRYYDKDKDSATWSIIINLPMEKGCLYVFDGRTGELLSKEIIDMRKER